MLYMLIIAHLVPINARPSIVNPIYFLPRNLYVFVRSRACFSDLDFRHVQCKTHQRTTLAASDFLTSGPTLMELSIPRDWISYEPC